MKILLCGASGFIGQAVRQQLARRGHEVLATRSCGPADARHPVVDFTQAHRPQDWLAMLQGDVEAVINAVGLFRGTPQRPLAAVHEAAPKALFEACVQAGVRRVVQVSALGVEDNPTDYARTKRAADDRLLALTQAGLLDGVVMRPSIVFGRGGASSELFMALARSPLLSLPRPVLHARVQPVALDDLAEAVARLMEGPGRPVQDIMHGVGPRPLTLAAFIASLRTQQGHGPAHVTALPDWLTRISARVGDHLPQLPWSTDTLRLLARDNVADPAPFEALLGRAPLAPESLVRLQWRD